MSAAIDAVLAIFEQKRDARVEAETECAMALELVRATLKNEAPLTDLSLLRRLYWEYPDIKVSEFADAFGLKPSKVWEHVNTSHTITRTCPHCDQRWSMTLRSRHAVVKLHQRPKWEGVDWCPSCQERRLSEIRERNAELAALIAGYDD